MGGADVQGGGGSAGGSDRQVAVPGVERAAGAFTLVELHRTVRGLEDDAIGPPGTGYQAPAPGFRRGRSENAGRGEGPGGASGAGEGLPVGPGGGSGAVRSFQGLRDWQPG
ncbi:hypothetical protein GCM10010347_61750 [Streptomyces cirratus]|uniref:Uncharacterized protein n=1 Tax=Streptomyces cirratus TaxID=68187 RepID=A0ABQ3F1M6_9ACTN|nr:hypothetical protein GCM10010347_61750 [Streptomyces cirratus]